MSVPVLEAIADAIYLYEGNKARDRAYRNRNPGNLRATDAITPQDEEHYRIFPSFVQGYNALLQDLAHKIFGHGHFRLNIDSSLEDLFGVFPSGSKNSSAVGYAHFAAMWLAAVYNGEVITRQTTFKRLYELAREDKPSGVPAA
jgi:hypothetical protein